MHPVVRATPFVALVWALGSLAPEPAPRAPIVLPPTNARGVTGLPVACGPRTIPEGDVCVPLPPLDASPDSKPDAGAPPPHVR